MKQYNYNKLKGKIKEYFPSQSDFARKLGISDASLSYKLNNRKVFDQDQISEIIDIFNLSAQATMDCFFSLEVDKKSTERKE